MKNKLWMLAMTSIVAVGNLHAAEDLQKQINDLRTKVELQQKDSVVAGDTPGSFRLPGSDTSIRLYGFAEFHWIKDFNVTAPGDDFSNTPELPTASGSRKGKSKMTVQTSRLGVETGTPTSYGPLNTKLEVDFYGYCGSSLNGNACNRNRLRLRHAYGEYAGFLIGQTWSAWMDLDSIPETVDFNGPVGVPAARNPMIRYSYSLPSIAKFTAALEDPYAGGSASVGRDIDQPRPNLVLRTDLSFGGVSVILRYLNSSYRYGTVAKTGNSYGVGVAWKVTASDTFMAQYNNVRGDYNWGYMVGANGASFDATNNLVLNDKSQGGLIGWTHVFNQKWRATAVYSETRNKITDDYRSLVGGTVAGNSLPNKKLVQYHINAIFTPIKNVDLGLEYLGGKRKTYEPTAGGDAGKANMSRVDFMAKYSF